ncbi:MULTISPECIES: ABC transporter permease [Treponema]|uniref:Carbohydrate ABC transporter membrane protein 1, CUT1 family n=2 Tax=Treponema saccharophilum TaxID=165 RepID=H7EJH1_9SPIR|nr:MULTISPECIES: ABC transporter permease subunit [Treponema]EIC02332.1 carbohydrate ABC transporter membrane protein 1, CUT1 family [Treponema saccharophilum DSM 2985]MBQ5537514.1 sugar ABC transporter permease [Treponema sp.]BDC97200.1 protein LplB [Treponema saccharophilum]
MPNEIEAVRKRSFLAYFLQHRWLYIMLIPGALYFIIFRYAPMFGLSMAFQQYSPFRGILGSKFVGLLHFKTFFTGTDFWMLMKNTLWLSFLSLIFYFPAPIILSLLLNEIRQQAFKRTIQTLIYVPHFISWVIVASITYTLFNVTDGAVNQALQALSGKVVNFLGLPDYFRPMIIGQQIWKETGYGTIIYLAALSGIDMELYEAARVDGAGRWRMMWYITLPSLKPTIIIMLILRVGSVLNTGYEQIFLMRNALNVSVAEVFDTYVYMRGLVNSQYSYSAAAGLFKSLVSMILVLFANWTAKKAGENGIY